MRLTEILQEKLEKFPHLVEELRLAKQRIIELEGRLQHIVDVVNGESDWD